MNWNSWNEFVAMGGYAPYVWGAVLMTAAALAAEVSALRWRRRKMLCQLRRRFPDAGREER